MTTNVFNLISTLFSSVWQLLTSFYIPGTNVTPAGLMIFVPTVVIGLKFFKRIFSAFGGNNEED